MSIYKLRYCKECDKQALLDFIKNHWQEDHIFLKSDVLFKFQHFNYLKDEYNFVIGINITTNEIDGIIGLIPLSQFDQNLSIYNEAWGGIWKVRTDVKNKEISMLGSKLFAYFKNFTSHGSLGMSNIATLLHKLRHYKVCDLSQYYILNRKAINFKIAKIPNSLYLNDGFVSQSTHTLKKIFNILELIDYNLDITYYPKKSITYLYNRFFLHPIYKYDFWGVFDDNEKLKVVLVIRKISINGTSALRIVDVLGAIENLNNMQLAFQKLLVNEKAEYIDLMNAGISAEVFEKIGFKTLDVTGEIIIPNYFEPFIQKNIVIKCAYKAPYNYVMFKADADQDRPSMVFIDV
jgi:hypothetical protein